MFKYHLAIITIFLTFFLNTLFLNFCSAENILGGDLAGQIADKGGYEVRGVDDTSFSKTVGRIIEIALGMVGTIFIALTIYAGILWMTASGEDEKVTKAKDILKASIIGLTITLAAYSITYFVTGWLIGSQGSPTLVGGNESAMEE